MRPYNCNCFFETKTKQLEKRNEKLLEQNRELVEALQKITFYCGHIKNSLHVRLKDTLPFTEAKQLLTKHSKNENV